MKKLNLIVCLLLTVVACQEKMPALKDSEVLLDERGGKTLENVKCPTIDMTEALSIIKPETDQYPGRWVDISKDIIPAGTSIDYAPLGIKALQREGAVVKSPNYDSWLAVVEYDVCKNGGYEEVLHFFINSDTGEYTSMWLDGKAIVEWDTSRNIYMDSETDNAKLESRSLPRVQTRASSSSTSPTQWAVILSGGGNMKSNYARYWNNCQHVYKALTQELNYPSNHIICLVSDGTDPANDRITGPNTYDSSPLDFDGDGVRDIEYSASKRDLATVFSYLGSVVSAGDEVLVFITDHGGKGGTICLWNNEILTPSELNAELNKITNSAMIDVIMGQCYSGAVIPAIVGSNRVIMSASGPNEMSYGSDINGYDYFLKHWTDAIYNIDPLVEGPYSNGDGLLSPKEMYEYAKDNNPLSTQDYEHPLISAATENLLWLHDLMGRVYNPYITGKEIASQYYTNEYVLHDMPSTLTPRWTCTRDLRVVSQKNNTFSVAGNLSDNQYVSLVAEVKVEYPLLNGRKKEFVKKIKSVWKPGAYSGNGYIVGRNGYYYLVHYPTYGTYPGTSGYMWEVANSSWSITQQDGAAVRVSCNPSSTYADLSVMFTDPYSHIIYITDRVQL